MKFIIYVAGRIRNGQRIGLADFSYNETHGKNLYLGRELTLEEFNAAAVKVFDPNYRSNGWTFCPAVLEVVESVDPPAEEVPIPVEEPVGNASAPVETPVENVPDAVESPAEDTPVPRFRIVGSEILEGDVVVAGFHDPGNHVRTVRGKAHLREEIQEFIKSLPQ